MIDKECTAPARKAAGRYRFSARVVVDWPCCGLPSSLPAPKLSARRLARGRSLTSQPYPPPPPPPFPILAMTVLFFLLRFLALASLTFSLPFDHNDSKRSPLPSAEWYHTDSHPVAKLFRRQNTTVAAVGSTGTHTPIITPNPIGGLPSLIFLLQLGRPNILPVFPKQTSLLNGYRR